MGLQLTNNTRNPASTTQLSISGTGSQSGYATTDGVYDSNGAETVSTGAYMYVRPVWLVNLSSGTTASFAFANANFTLILE